MLRFQPWLTVKAAVPFTRGKAGQGKGRSTGWGGGAWEHQRCICFRTCKVRRMASGGSTADDGNGRLEAKRQKRESQDVTRVHHRPGAGHVSQKWPLRNAASQRNSRTMKLPTSAVPGVFRMYSHLVL